MPSDQNPLHKPPPGPANLIAQPSQPLPPNGDDEELNIGELIATFLEYKWLIAAVTGLVSLLGVLYILLATPIYRADALLQIEDKKNGGLTALKDLSPLLGDTTAVVGEVEIIKSRRILGQVVSRLQLDIDAQPRYFPIIGRALARRYKESEPASPLLGLSSFAWGGEQIKVERLEVPFDEIGERLTLIAGNDGQYQLLNSDKEPVLNGVVGQAAEAKGFKIFVSQLVARPDTRFKLQRTKQQDAIEDLLEQLTVKEVVKQSGVVALTLSGPDADLTARTLADITNTYIRQNVEYRSSEAEKTLKFLEVQLPTLKTQVDNAEAAYNNYRKTRGSVDLSLETQGVLGSLVDVDKDLVKLQQERESLRQGFTAEHPRIQAIDAQIARLRAKSGQFNSEVSKLPETQQNVLRLKRDLDLSAGLYMDLLNSAQQLRVSKEGTIGDARIVDTAALASKPIWPKKPIILAASLVLGFLISLTLVWLLKALRVVVEDPEKIEKHLGLPVYATIPRSADEISISNRAKASKNVAELLAISHPEDDAIESLRSLRTTIHFALLDSAKGSLLITGPCPGIGKSFISKNLGAVLAQTGKRVVVVDADLRKGHINKEFGFKRDHGVSEYVIGTSTIDAILKQTQVPGLTVVTTGQIPPNPSELLMHPRFEQLLEKLGDDFDIVIVDAPPILAVSDAAIIGRLTGATLLVARAGQHPLREIEQAIKRLHQSGVQVKGCVFNDLDTTRQRYRYGYAGYQYRYSYK